MEAASHHLRLLWRPPVWSVPVAGAGAAALTVAAGQWIKADGGRLGAFFPPFYAHWYPYFGSLLPISVLVLGVGAASTPYWIWRIRAPVAVALTLYGLALALGVSLNIARGGVHDLWAVFKLGPGGSLEAHQEYLPGLSALAHGIPSYVRHFPALIPSLPIHVQGNPPGPLVALDLLGIRTAGELAALCIGLGALTAPLAYDLGRTLGGEQRGRLAGVLTAFAPGLLVWGVTSADYAFAALGMASACLLLRRHPVPLTLGALLGASVTFFSWLLFAVPAWAALVVLRREGMRRALWLIVVCALALGLVYLALWLAWGYDPFATIRATGLVYHHGIARIRPYAYWVFGSPAAWWIGLGLPIGWLLLRATGAGDPAGLAVIAAVLAAAALGLTKAETERIWLPFVPLACLAAAAALPRRRLGLMLWLLAAQALAVELLFDTVW